VVDWNSAEKSWDCPCHGARYNLDGEVITGPARKGLEKITLGKD
jgi:Rieske Fe-S protein